MFLPLWTEENKFVMYMNQLRESSVVRSHQYVDWRGESVSWGHTSYFWLWTVNLESTIMRCNGRIGCCKLCRNSSLWASFVQLSLSEKSVPFHMCLCWVQLFNVHVIILYRIIKQRHLDQDLICLPELSNALWLQQDIQSNNSNPCFERLRFYVYMDILNCL